MDTATILAWYEGRCRVEAQREADASRDAVTGMYAAGRLLHEARWAAVRRYQEIEQWETDRGERHPQRGYVGGQIAAFDAAIGMVDAVLSRYAAATAPAGD